VILGTPPACFPAPPDKVSASRVLPSHVPSPNDVTKRDELSPTCRFEPCHVVRPG